MNLAEKTNCYFQKIGLQLAVSPFHLHNMLSPESAISAYSTSNSNVCLHQHQLPLANIFGVGHDYSGFDCQQTAILPHLTSLNSYFIK